MMLALSRVALPCHGDFCLLVLPVALTSATSVRTVALVLHC
jgi:hypothetical protein